jgi:hypothetical protein
MRPPHAYSGLAKTPALSRRSFFFFFSRSNAASCFPCTPFPSVPTSLQTADGSCFVQVKRAPCPLVSCWRNPRPRRPLSRRSSPRCVTNERMTINGFQSRSTTSSSFQDFRGRRSRREVQYPIRPGPTLTPQTPHIIQEHKGEQFTAKPPPGGWLTASKEGASRLTHRGLKVLVCLCDGPVVAIQPAMPSRPYRGAVAYIFSRNILCHVYART